MLASSGGGLILYQAYGNLYAMTGRKAHLLEDKEIPNVGVFDERESKPDWEEINPDGWRNWPTSCGLTEPPSIKVMGEIPFSLTLSEASSPEIGMPTYRTMMVREDFNKEELHLNLDLLQERREMAAI
ncbi:hypothetical protein Tco_1121206 [Tanacetum coccineum]|uniref:Uncharacterized protein n=1 Tax=Tanacetum coccineum TaxID=301880 RepID=A0ABQ5IY16_9ASTR